MRLTPRRFVIFIFAVISLFFLISYLAPDDESHRPRPNIKARRLDNIYNNENQIIQEDKRSNESQDEKKVQSIKDSEKEIDLSKTRGKDLGKLIDWHNYTLMKLEAKREGRGEREKVKLMEEEQKSVSMGKYGYSKFVSDLVSLDRAIRDIRHPLCASKLYHENLPDTSIIMPFHNEAPSVLLRSVHSILNKSPSHLIREIILVNDASTHEELNRVSEFHVEVHKLPKTRVIYSDNRLGLIEARSLGARNAEGEVLTFLDSHIECSYNWLPPLLDRIAMNWKSVPQPMIDVVDGKNFNYEEQPGGILRGSFSWELLYKRLPITARERASMEDAASPIKTPVQAGGLFSIHRDWFWLLGGYDPFLKIWGAEQYEISFKVWMCGGEMEEVPCSRVGHIYRSHMSFSVPGGHDVIGMNHYRIAELWMDEYKEYYLKHKPGLKGRSLGDDLEERRQIRTKLKCKSFKWYMENVAYDQGWYYPAVEPKPYATGRCRSKQKETMCLHINGGDNGGTVLKKCASKDVKVPHFKLTWRREMRKQNGRDCLDLARHVKGAQPEWFQCHEQGGNQKWLYMKDTLQIKHDLDTRTKLCLSTDGSKVFMDICDGENEDQKWTFDAVDFSEFREDLGPPYDRSLDR